MCCSMLQYAAGGLRAHCVAQITVSASMTYCTCIAQPLACHVLQCVAVCGRVLQSVAKCCSALQCLSGCCRLLQGVTGCCRVLQSVVECCKSVAGCCRVLQSVAGCCRALQSVAVYCILQMHRTCAAHPLACTVL